MKESKHIPDTGPNAELQFLRESLQLLQECSTPDKTCQCIIDSIYSLIGEKGIVTLADIDQAEKSWQIREVRGVGSKTKNLIELLGFDFKKFRGKLNPAYSEAMKAGGFVKLKSNLPVLLNNAISNKAASAIKKLLDLDSIYSAEMRYNDRYHANISIITKYDIKDPVLELAEIFVAQAAIYLDKFKVENHFREKEEELKKRNEFVQIVLDRLPIGLAMNKFDEGTATYINDKFAEIYGWPKEDLSNINTFFEKVYPDTEYRNKLVKQVMDDINSGEPERMHWENVSPTTKDGKRKYVNAVNIPLLDQNTMVSTVMDVTKLKEAEQELQKHQNKLQELVKARTKELEKANKDLKDKNKELEHFNELFVGREFRINELKEKIKILEEKLEQKQ
ncbi:MAG: PAS domain S-box protein [Bacteroidales bacterium]|nr:PAS domain S-box protein [Bacteroidales bacterium]MCF8388185.1 PAS domain S-box protein [Bacteroidales bacterium]